MLFKIIIMLTPLVFAFQIQLINYINGNDTHHIHGLENVNLSDINIAATGDWSCTFNTKNTVENIINKSPELILGLGDYAYRNDAACWLEIINPIENKMKIAIGNHDDKAYVDGIEVPSNERLEEYMNQFNLTEQFYSFDYHNVHFLAISTEDSYEKNSMQYRFVQNDLKNAASNNNTNWIVVFYHRVAYTSPGMVGSVVDFRDTYHPLFDKYGVDIVLQAHTHNYQRSFPISYNTGNSSNPIIKDHAISNYNDPNGQIFAIVGTGGSNVIHNLTGAPAKFTAKQFYGYGFLNLDFTQNGTTLVGEFHDNNDTIKDRFSITKSNIKQNSSLTSSPPSPRLTNEFEGRFKIETVVKGLKSPTDMVFPDSNDPNDMIVLEQNKGAVQRIVYGELQDRPLIDVNVSSKGERGLLGIVTSATNSDSPYVFLYYTETEEEGSDICPNSNYCVPGTEPLGNRLYRYELTQDETKLINPKLLLDLPAIPGPGHNGGKVIISPDENIFLVIGDLKGRETEAENFENGQEPDMTGGVLRIDQEGHPLNEGPLGSIYPLNLYYAYGIRNSFGMDFDPITGNLWNTENGPEFGDEINLVRPGFNSGWKDVQGIWQHKGGKPQNILRSPDNLVDFDGKGKYSSPEFTFFNPVGLTAIKFFNSDKMGIEYEDDLFVGDINNGKIYHFELNDDRTSLVLDGELDDKIANSNDELDKVTFAEGFSGITDLEVGPDGYLYVLSYGKGTIYRISPK